MNDSSLLSADDAEELTILAERFCDGVLTPADAERLEQMLRGQPARQTIFLAQVDLHARLCWEAAHGAPPTIAPPMPPLAASSRRLFKPWAAMTLVGAMLLFVSVAATVWYRSRPETPSIDTSLVKVIHAAGVSRDQANDLVPGRALSSGTLELPHGIVELAYASGVRLLLESPVRIELVDAGRAYLHNGRLVARVPERAQGFVVESTRARIVDLGTEFGVSVAPQGATRVQVYEGAIDAVLKQHDGRAKVVDRITTGEALAIDASAEPMNFAADRFIRSFPVAPKRSEPIRLSNRSENAEVRTHRAAAPPTIDGDLSDWEGAETFTCRCSEPNGGRYYIEGRFLVDSKRLYFAAHVGDPCPLASTTDPEQEPDYYWTGGSVVLRLAADRSFPWPLNAKRPASREVKTSPHDLSEKIVHIGMWFSRRLQQPQLMLHYGMDCHGEKLNPGGWQGAYREDADGLGYTMEYALDWRLLHVERPPKPGDVWPANLNVHWSDRDGRTCMGILSDLISPDSDSHNPFLAVNWGKLFFSK